MRNLRRFLLPSLLLACSLASGCVYTNIRMPWAYRSATPSDVKAAAADESVTGRSCFRSVLYLVAWGDGSYAAAVDDALQGHEGAVLYDVKSDVHAVSALVGLYTRRCTIVTGRVGAP